MSVQPDYKFKGFQAVSSELGLSKLLATIAIVCNSDGTNTLSLNPLYSQLTKQGILINTPEVRDVLLLAKDHTILINEFIVVEKVTVKEFQLAKHALLVDMCPGILDNTTLIKFSPRANDPLILPDTPENNII